MSREFKIRERKEGIDKYLMEVLKLYESVDKAHGREHIEDVLGNAEQIVMLLNDDTINMDIVRTAIVFHDIGIVTHGRKNHNENSAEFVLNDDRLEDFFSDLEIKIISDACREHRASFDGQYSSIYSKIVSDSDRDSSIETMIIRSYKYTKYHNPDLGEGSIYKEVYKHLRDKYGYDGYAKYNLEESYALRNSVMEILEDEGKFKLLYLDITQ